MQLHTIHKSSHDKRAKRIGRSGKRGSYSGRGVKGQKSRAGRRIRPAERDLIMRIPKLRGFANKEKTFKPVVFNLEDLELTLKAHSGSRPIILNIDFLKQAELLSPRFKGSVKILADGDITVPIEVQKISVSQGAKAKIEKAGGKVQDRSR